MPSRRSHTNSHHGCLQCKAKRVKVRFVVVEHPPDIMMEKMKRQKWERDRDPNMNPSETVRPGPAQVLAVRQEEQRVHIPAHHDQLQPVPISASRAGSGRSSSSRGRVLEGRGSRRIRIAARSVDASPGLHDDDHDPDHSAQGHPRPLGLGLSLEQQEKHSVVVVEVLVCTGDARPDRHNGRPRAACLIVVGGKEDIFFLPSSTLVSNPQHARS